ncbi:MAG: hypothetical protein WCO86_11445, partial [Planctomycetota bacterium]
DGILKFGPQASAAGIRDTPLHDNDAMEDVKEVIDFHGVPESQSAETSSSTLREMSQHPIEILGE